VFLNQSKFYREQINVANGQLNMIEEQISRIEMAQHQKEAIQVLEQGNKILKALNEEVNIEKWESIADNMNEMKQQQDEIGNFLRNHNIDETEFDEQVTKDLEKLMKDENAILPDAGTKEVVVNSQIEQRRMITS
jgi:ABC-type lipopolysaccharide export system ATPase subunit